MAPKVHGSVFSTATMRALAALHEKGIEFEFVPIDMRAEEHKQEPYLSLNPFGQVPAYEDGDLKLFESRAITKYIAFEHHGRGTELIYHDAKKMTMVSVWMEVESLHFNSVAMKLVWEQALKLVMINMESDWAIVEENQKKMSEILDVYEARLSKSRYLGGDDFSLADLHHLPTMHYMMGTSAKELFEARPHVSVWAKNILARPAWIKTVEMQNNRSKLKEGFNTP